MQRPTPYSNFLNFSLDEEYMLKIFEEPPICSNFLQLFSSRECHLRRTRFLVE